MAISDSIRQKATGLLQTVGRSAMATLYPNDFEVYLCSLELADSQGNTIDMFTFPINPDGISKTEPKKTSIQSTAGGTTVLTSPVFIPKEINIRGNFGRTFKILLNVSDGAVFNGSAMSISAGKYALYQIQGKATNSLKAPAFDMNVKNGFGCIKILQSIIDKSNGVDDLGLPMRLYFYNMALGESYLVVIPPTGITFSQNVQKNMIWEYNLNMTAVAPLEAVKSAAGAKTSLKSLCSAGAIQKSVNDLASAITSNMIV